MATWVRQGTGTAPQSTDANLSGTYELNNGVAPGDFDPDAVNSVRIQWTITGTNFVDDTWTDQRGAALTLDGDGSVLAGVDGTDAAGLGNEASNSDETDSSIPTGFTIAQWQGAELNDWSASPGAYALYVANMKSDGGVLTMSAVTVTIDYTPGAAGSSGILSLVASVSE